MIKECESTFLGTGAVKVVDENECSTNIYLIGLLGHWPFSCNSVERYISKRNMILVYFLTVGQSYALHALLKLLIRISRIYQGLKINKKYFKTLSCVLYQIPKNPGILFSNIPGSGFESNPGIPGFPGSRRGLIIVCRKFDFALRSNLISLSS